MTSLVNLAGVVRPGSLSPVAEAACLQQQIVQQRLAIFPAAGGAGVSLDDRVKLLVKLGAELVHRSQDIFVALHPTAIVRPGGAFHGEIGVLRLGSSDRLIDRLWSYIL